MTIRKQTKLWTTREKHRIRICDMSDKHLINTLRMLKRVAIKEKAEQSRIAQSFASMMTAEMASHYADQEVDRIHESHWSDERFTSGFWEPMMLDAQRRGGHAYRTACRIENDEELSGVEMARL